MKFHEADNASDALQVMRNRGADVVITDVRMPGVSGVDLLKELRSEYPSTVVILVTAFGTVESAVEAMKAGARDYITRPLDLDNLASVVQRAVEKRSEVRILRTALDKKRGFENMLGHGLAFLADFCGNSTARIGPARNRGRRLWLSNARRICRKST